MQGIVPKYQQVEMQNEFLAMLMESPVYRVS